MDDHGVALTWPAVSRGALMSLRMMDASEPVDPASYYFRVAIRYETSAPKHAWLNRTLAIASAIRLADQVIYDAYAVR